MIADKLQKQNQRIGYYKIIMIVSAALVLIWILLTIQSSINKKFEDKQAQAAAKAISPDFDLEIINSLADKYNPTELELRKINPYTETRPVESSPNPVYFLEESSDSADIDNLESSDSANLNN